MLQREHRCKAQGFILLMMLIFMQVIALLTMQSVAAVTYLKKLTYHRINAESRRQRVLQALAYVDSVKKPACEVEVNSAILMLRHDFSWWELHGCGFMIDENQYFFVRETLGFDECAVITSLYNQSVIPVFYRNTLLYHSAVNRNKDMMVQDTIAVASEVSPSCHDSPKPIKHGRQMLRWL